jgi:D-glycero-alpha-D-manno-heptose-7-phosphate kinase
MIVARSPLRITLGGGGTDLPSYYLVHGGFVLSAAIDRYVYIALHRTFVDDLIVKYSSMERVSDASQVRHPIVREALAAMGLDGKGLEIVSMADLPSGTGLGSSGSFATALLKALHALKNNAVSPRELAEEACAIEIDRLREPVGKQDQYIATHGGVTEFEFGQDGAVTVRPLSLTDRTLADLEDGLALFFTGYSRRAGAILEEQDRRTREGGADMIENLHVVKELGLRSRNAIAKGALAEFGHLMHEHWQRKKRRSGAMSNPQIDAWYELGLANGALGGKLIGAGGGGFLMFYTEDRPRLRRAMAETGLQEVRVRFEREGTKILNV